MSQKLIIPVLIVLFLIAGVIMFKQNNEVQNKQTSPTTNINTSQNTSDPTEVDIDAIRSFMAEPDLELTFINTDLPMPYFRVGKVTKMGNGENMEKVDGWVRQVNVYNQKDLLNGLCNVYEYHTDIRNHTLTAVIIRGLRSSEVEDLRKNGVNCSTSSNIMPKISKAEAETVAMDYLRRAVSNLDQIKGQLTYSLQSNGESHQWLWEDKNFKLPNGLESRPYLYPIIRISVNGDKTISYWNTVSLFQD